MQDSLNSVQKLFLEYKDIIQVKKINPNSIQKIIADILSKNDGN